MDAPVRYCDIEQLEFRGSFVNALPGDGGPNQVRQTPGVCYARVAPRPVAKPGLIAYSDEMLETLGLDRRVTTSEEFAEIFAGNRLVEGMDPHAMCYGGHQFGTWAGQLGDGRAINLGEVAGRDGGHWMLQLKGAGKTPYSRMADGLAVLRSSIREFLCSEAMHHLGIPTTRALSIVSTGESVVRDMFYDGNPREEPGAVVCRVAPSFLRFGNFEIHAARGETEILRNLADYAIRTEFADIHEAFGKTGDRRVYIEWFREICRRTADLMVEWMRVGFVHGVMNTDNMSILGLTIDYGPYGWLEDYDPNWTPNTTDASGRRYSFGNQPRIAMWNLNQFANAIYPLIESSEPLEEALGEYAERFNSRWRETMAAKLGFARHEPGDESIFGDLTRLLTLAETDMTLFFRKLADVGDDTDILTTLDSCWYRKEELTADYRAQLERWITDYRERLARDGLPIEQRRERMNRVNPKYVLRNYLAQVAIDAAEQGDYSEVGRLLDVMRRPYDDQPKREDYASRRPEWARSRPGCSMLSCSS
jgi:uncharacterized protein YdiU (UPF0061 family)